MADDINAAYLKLTQTPLAKTTTCFGLSAATWTVIVGILSIILNVLPGFIFASRISKEWDERDVDEFFKQGDQPLKHICIAILVIFSLIQLIGAVLVIVGGLRRNPRFLYFWFCGFCFSFVAGRFICGIILLANNVHNLAVNLLVYSIVDVIVAGLLVTSIIRLTGQFRNEKYQQIQSTIVIKPDQNVDQVNVLPAGSYPRQI